MQCRCIENEAVSATGKMASCSVLYGGHESRIKVKPRLEHGRVTHTVVTI